MFETTNELILVISTCIAGVCSIIAAIRLSKCEYVRVCGGLFLIKRNLLNNSKAPTSTTGHGVGASPTSTPSQATLDKLDSSSTMMNKPSNSITKIIQGISNGINKTDVNASNDIENPPNISPSASTVSLHSAISV